MNINFYKKMRVSGSAIGFVCGFLSMVPVHADAAVATAQLAKTSSHGAGTVYYPDDNLQHGVVVIMPGYNETQYFTKWYGPLLAGNGFVAVTLDSLAGGDLQTARANQLAAALDDIKLKFWKNVDATRTVFMGHSTGGGATLDAAVKDNRLKAIIPYAPWQPFPATAASQYGRIQVPTLIISCASDVIAPNNTNSDVFYNSIPSGTHKTQITMANAVHSCANTDGTVPPGFIAIPTANDKYKPAISHFVIAWLKYHVDGQLQYKQDLCGANAVQAEVSQSRNNWCN